MNLNWVRFTVSEQSQSPRLPGQSGDRLGHTRKGQTGGLATLQLPKNQETPCLGQWEAGTWPPAPFKPSEHARTGVPYRKVRGYKGVTVHASTDYWHLALSTQGEHVPVPEIMPQTGGQRAFPEVHPGPLRFHPPTPKAPSRVH